MTMTDSRITATATGIPDKLREEIRRVIYYYNQNTLESNRVVFLEIDDTYYKGRVTKNENGEVVAFRKLTVDAMRTILTTAGRWRTRVRFTKTETNWWIVNGGKCPRDVAYFAVYEVSPDDLSDLPIYSLSQESIRERES